MFCKRKGTDGPVFLWTAVKEKNKEMVRCNADGSDIGSEPKATKSRKKQDVVEAPVVAAETPAAVE